MARTATTETMTAEIGSGVVPSTSASSESITNGKRRDNNFLEKLWNFIADDASTPIIGFSSNGQYLVIYDPDAVPIALTESQICKHKDYQSFQRQMTIYGWRRISQNELNKIILDNETHLVASTLGPNVKVMQHEHLVRDSPMDEVKAVVRKAKPKASRAKGAVTGSHSDRGSTSPVLSNFFSLTPLDARDQAVDGASNNQHIKRKSEFDMASSKRQKGAEGLGWSMSDVEVQMPAPTNGLSNQNTIEAFDFQRLLAGDDRSQNHSTTAPLSSAAIAGQQDHGLGGYTGFSDALAPEVVNGGSLATLYPSLPHSLQEAFRMLRGARPLTTEINGQALYRARSSLSIAKDPVANAVANVSAFASSALPPLPPLPVGALAGAASNNIGDPAMQNLQLAAVQNQPFDSAGLLSSSFLTSSATPLAANVLDIALVSPPNSTPNIVSPKIDQIPPPFYYQPAPGNHFANTMQPTTDAVTVNKPPLSYYSVFSPSVQSYGQ